MLAFILSLIYSTDLRPW